MLAMAVARKWQQVYSNTVDPGWVPTKMGGFGAADDTEKISDGASLADNDDDQARV